MGQRHLGMFKIIKTQIKILSILFLGVISFSSHAQDSNLGNWFMYIGNKKINSKWNIHNEIQYRNYNAIGDLEQLLLRAGVGHNLTENNNNILLGYGYILSKNYSESTEDKSLVNEHRVFQQFTTKQSIGNIKLSHRYRFEQRFVEDDDAMPLGLLLALACRLVAPGFGGGNRQVDDGLAVLGVAHLRVFPEISHQNYLVHRSGHVHSPCFPGTLVKGQLAHTCVRWLIHTHL